MNIALCYLVMKECINRAPRNPDWKRIGQLISRNVEKNESASVEDIAERVLAQYRGQDGATTVE